MAQVGTLEIEIVTTGEGAARSIQNVTGTLREMRTATERATKSVSFLQKIVSSLGRIAFYRVIRSAIKAITQAFSEGAKNAYNFSKAFESQLAGTKTIAQAYDSLSSASFKMQNQLGAAWASLIRAIEPILLTIINLVTRAANAITQFFALLGGRTTYLKAIDYSKEWGETTAAGAKAAKEWKNQLMGFDVINRLEAPSNSGGGGGSSLPDYGSMFEEVPINTKLASAFGEIKTLIETNLAQIELIVGGAALGIGAILTFSGANIPLGIALMVAGLATSYSAIKENWGLLAGKIGAKLSLIGSIVGGAALGVGAVLALSGANVPLGIGLMIAGLSMSAASLNWSELSEKTKEKLALIGGIAGMAMLALGTVFLLTGHIPLGLGMVAAGVIAIAKLGANWDSIPAKVQTILGLILKIVGGALFAIGLILLLTGNAPLGIGLMIAGGAMVVKSNGMVNWDYLAEKAGTAMDNVKKKMKEKWDSLVGWWKGLSLPNFKIKLPHLSWYTTEASGWLGRTLEALGLPASIPHLAVDWYAKGGVISGASLIGVGEAGAEAIVPLERNTQWIGKVAAEMNRQTRNYDDNDSEMVVTALYDVANMIVREMHNSNNKGMSFDRLAKEVTRWQSDVARANG